MGRPGPSAEKTNGQSTDFSSKLPATPDFSRISLPYLYGVRNGERSGRPSVVDLPETFREPPAPAARRSRPPKKSRRVGSNIRSALVLETHADGVLAIVDREAVRDQGRSDVLLEAGAQQIRALDVNRELVAEIVGERRIQPAQVLGVDRVVRQSRVRARVDAGIERTAPVVGHTGGHRSFLVHADQVEAVAGQAW